MLVPNLALAVTPLPIVLASPTFTPVYHVTKNSPR